MMGLWRRQAAGSRAAAAAAGSAAAAATAGSDHDSDYSFIDEADARSSDAGSVSESSLYDDDHDEPLAADGDRMAGQQSDHLELTAGLEGVLPSRPQQEQHEGVVVLRYRRSAAANPSNPAHDEGDALMESSSAPGHHQACGICPGDCTDHDHENHTSGSDADDESLDSSMVDIILASNDMIRGHNDRHPWAAAPLPTPSIPLSPAAAAADAAMAEGAVAVPADADAAADPIAPAAAADGDDDDDDGYARGLAVVVEEEEGVTEVSAAGTECNLLPLELADAEEKEEEEEEGWELDQEWLDSADGATTPGDRTVIIPSEASEESMAPGTPIHGNVFPAVTATVASGSASCALGTIIGDVAVPTPANGSASGGINGTVSRGKRSWAQVVCGDQQGCSATATNPTTTTTTTTAATSSRTTADIAAGQGHLEQGQQQQQQQHLPVLLLLPAAVTHAATCSGSIQLPPLHAPVCDAGTATADALTHDGGAVLMDAAAVAAASVDDEGDLTGPAAALSALVEPWQCAVAELREERDMLAERLLDTDARLIELESSYQHLSAAYAASRQLLQQVMEAAADSNTNTTADETAYSAAAAAASEVQRAILLDAPPPTAVAAAAESESGAASDAADSSVTPAAASTATPVNAGSVPSGGLQRKRSASLLAAPPPQQQPKVLLPRQAQQQQPARLPKQRRLSAVEAACAAPGSVPVEAAPAAGSGLRRRKRNTSFYMCHEASQKQRITSSGASGSSNALGEARAAAGFAGATAAVAPVAASTAAGSDASLAAAVAAAAVKVQSLADMAWLAVVLLIQHAADATLEVLEERCSPCGATADAIDDATVAALLPAAASPACGSVRRKAAAGRIRRCTARQRRHDFDSGVLLLGASLAALLVGSAVIHAAWSAASAAPKTSSINAPVGSVPLLAAADGGAGRVPRVLLLRGSAVAAGPLPLLPPPASKQAAAVSAGRRQQRQMPLPPLPAPVAASNSPAATSNLTVVAPSLPWRTQAQGQNATLATYALATAAPAAQHTLAFMMARHKIEALPVTALPIKALPAIPAAGTLRRSIAATPARFSPAARNSGSSSSSAGTPTAAAPATNASVTSPAQYSTGATLRQQRRHLALPAPAAAPRDAPRPAAPMLPAPAPRGCSAALQPQQQVDNAAGRSLAIRASGSDLAVPNGLATARGLTVSYSLSPDVADAQSVCARPHIPRPALLPVAIAASGLPAAGQCPAGLPGAAPVALPASSALPLASLPAPDAGAACNVRHWPSLPAPGASSAAGSAADAAADSAASVADAAAAPKPAPLPAPGAAADAGAAGPRSLPSLPHPDGGAQARIQRRPSLPAPESSSDLKHLNRTLQATIRLYRERAVAAEQEAQTLKGEVSSLQQQVASLQDQLLVLRVAGDWERQRQQQNVEALLQLLMQERQQAKVNAMAVAPVAAAGNAAVLPPPPPQQQQTRPASPPVIIAQAATNTSTDIATAPAATDFASTALAAVNLQPAALKRALMHIAFAVSHVSVRHVPHPQLALPAAVDRPLRALTAPQLLLGGLMRNTSSGQRQPVQLTLSQLTAPAALPPVFDRRPCFAVRTTARSAPPASSAYSNSPVAVYVAANVSNPGVAAVAASAAPAAAVVRQALPLPALPAAPLVAAFGPLLDGAISSNGSVRPAVGVHHCSKRLLGLPASASRRARLPLAPPPPARAMSAAPAPAGATPATAAQRPSVNNSRAIILHPRAQPLPSTARKLRAAVAPASDKVLTLVPQATPAPPARQLPLLPALAPPASDADVVKPHQPASTAAIAAPRLLALPAPAPAVPTMTGAATQTKAIQIAMPSAYKLRMFPAASPAPAAAAAASAAATSAVTTQASAALAVLLPAAAAAFTSSRVSRIHGGSYSGRPAATAPVASVLLPAPSSRAPPATLKQQDIGRGRQQLAAAAVAAMHLIPRPSPSPDLPRPLPSCTPFKPAPHMPPTKRVVNATSTTTATTPSTALASVQLMGAVARVAHPGANARAVVAAAAPVAGVTLRSGEHSKALVPVHSPWMWLRQLQQLLKQSNNNSLVIVKADGQVGAVMVIGGSSAGRVTQLTAVLPAAPATLQAESMAVMQAYNRDVSAVPGGCWVSAASSSRRSSILALVPATAPRLLDADAWAEEEAEVEEVEPRSKQLVAVAPRRVRW